MGWTQPPHTTSAALRWRFLWLGFGASIGVVDAWRSTKHDGSTISELNRVAFATHTRQGRATFVATLGALGALYAHHILYPKGEQPP